MMESGNCQTKKNVKQKVFGVEEKTGKIDKVWKMEDNSVKELLEVH